MYRLEVLAHYEAMDRPKVYVTIAGRSNACGLVDGIRTVHRMSSGAFLRRRRYFLPSGVAPAVVLDAGNTALLAAKILSLGDPSLKAKLKLHSRHIAKVIDSDGDLNG